MGGIEHRGLERLLEAVHIDQHVSAAGLRSEIAGLGRHRLDPVETPIPESDGGEGKTALVRGDQPGLRDRHARRALRPEPGFGAAAVHGLARGDDEQCWVSGERGRVEACAGRTQAGASAECEGTPGRRKSAEESAARYGMTGVA